MTFQNERVETAVPWGTMLTRPALLDETVIDEVVHRDCYRLSEIGMLGKTVVDCGGHIGVFSARCAAWGATTVVAVEPEPENLALLRENTARWPQVRIVPMAIGSKVDGRTKLAGESGGAHLDPNGEGAEVNTITLPYLLSEFPTVDLLKLDMEGAEVDALLSCSHDVLSHVDQIRLETHGPKSCPWVLRPRVGELIEHLLPTHNIDHVSGFPTHLGLLFASRNGTAAPW